MYAALMIIDMLNDFVLETGALPVPGADKLIPRILELTKATPRVIFCNDVHDFPDAEPYPTHCVTGTDGALIVIPLRFNFIPTQAYYFSKKTYDATTNSGLKTLLNEKKIDTLFVTGVATEICILGTVKALSALHGISKIYVVTDCVAGIEAQKAEEALSDMKGIATLITSGEAYKLLRESK